jgi:hypothetical protein
LPVASEGPPRNVDTLSAATPSPVPVAFMAVLRAETLLLAAFLIPGELVRFST